MSLRERLEGRANPLLAVCEGRQLEVEGVRWLEPSLHGHAVALSVADPLVLIELLVACDGVAEAVLLISASASEADVRRLMGTAGAAVLVSDRGELAGRLAPDDALGTASTDPDAARATEWLVTTSGTTGPTKVVRHSIGSLTRTVRSTEADHPVWGLVYDLNRFAGLQVLFQALFDDGTLLAPVRHAAPDLVEAFIQGRCDHLSATPSLWRRLLMHPRSSEIPLSRATLGGEAPDDAVLRAVAARFPTARVSHIYASTEAGVGFTVTDGRAGFPSDYLVPGRVQGVDLKVVDGELLLRPHERRSAYVGDATSPVDDDGFVRSGDLVAVDGDRVRFLGRVGSGINVGGINVQPTEVEAVLYQHPHVVLCRVGSRPSPVTGALLTAEVVSDGGVADEVLKKELLALCRERLVREAIPRKLTIVPELELSNAGKVLR